MKTWKKIALGLLFVLIVFAVWFYPKFKMLNLSMHLFEEDQIVHNFRSFDAVWPVSELEAPSTKHPYAKGTALDLPKSFQFDGETYNTNKFLEDSWTTGFLVIQNDSLVYENYYLGNTEATRNISWSMAKSVISALMGIAVEEGDIKSIEEPVDNYAPELKGSAYEGVRIKDVLQMSTGVKFNEDYGDFNSDINRWGRGFALGDSQDEFATTLERELEPGTVNHYVSINTHVLGMVLKRATGKTITEYMQEKLYNPLGMEYNGYWLLDGENMEMVLGGLNLTLRDYAKVGSLFINEGVFNGQQIVPKSWVEASTTPDAPHVQPGEGFGYGYQWWIPSSEQGEYMAMGVYGQYIYINPTTKTVIVKLSANPKYNDDSYIPSNDTSHIEMFRAIASSFKKDEADQELVSITE
ncbi:serine hydrolase domain-containing protein [Xanthomarina sp. F2636L]|uniref:serine hydrolase domain-containing protein n=1 Tax=Xanthomarina sp. F2636L TaxID=2996018 RepID=UPI00225E04D2|nr:serine hydrolase [Xanthomarina sp. F2636L]MCX7550912.1 serine hydrolase [Xanthomarina sp. F2636L]